MIHFLNDIAALNAGHGCRSGQIERNRSLVRFDGDGELKKTAALPFGVYGPRDVEKNLVPGRKAKPAAVRQFAAFARTLQQCVQKIFSPCVESSWAQRARDG